MSVKMQKVYDIASNIDSKLLSADERFMREVNLIHEDGSVMHFRNAFLMCVRTEELGPWVLCFTEHFGFHVFPMEDLLGYRQFEYVDIEDVVDENL